ncbi:hypothetical protein [Gracilimonas mengyeensis]|uniref:hypothetical protein n=1 Tax=Gracilimonas mengyeensis TaxID=1302730 RepID=UPI001158393C|nr:hypothetical protein [Gracilimonas mengyeensis]
MAKAAEVAAGMSAEVLNFVWVQAGRSPGLTSCTAGNLRSEGIYGCGGCRSLGFVLLTNHADREPR